MTFWQGVGVGVAASFAVGAVAVIGFVNWVNGIGRA